MPSVTIDIRIFGQVISTIGYPKLAGLIAHAAR